MDLQKVARKEVEAIIKETGLTQGEISVRAGYAEQSLTQMLSNGEVSERMLKNIRREFSDVLKNSITELKDVPPKISFAEKPEVDEPNRNTAEVQKSLANLSEANKDACHANVVLAENQRELIQMLKSKQHRQRLCDITTHEINCTAPGFPGKNTRFSCCFSRSFDFGKFTTLCE